MKRIISILALLIMLISVLTIPASAAKTFQTYTYSIGGTALYSPDAYTAVKSIDSDYMGLTTPLNAPRDIHSDGDQNVYISDPNNNRIVVLDRYYKLKFEISAFVNRHGVNDSLKDPQGIFVTDDRYTKDQFVEGKIYVCDTGNNRVVVFDKSGKQLSVINAPKSSLFGDRSTYKPVAIAVDDFGRLFVVSATTYQGIIVMTSEGNFSGFVGTQKVAVGFWDIIWRRFRTEEQTTSENTFISTEYNNISINKDGHIYITTSSIEEGTVAGAINSKATDGSYLPVKLYNAKGDEIMRRNGFWPPAGEIDFSTSVSADVAGPSEVIDVAVGPENTWSIIDSKRNKVFTYDYDGNLLFAFGDKGQQLGNITNIKAITYQDNNMLILDITNNNFTVFQRTEYGNALIRALEYQNDFKYDLAADEWREVLKRNQNFDTAYIGIGNALYRSGQYEESLEYYKAAYDTVNYSNSFKELRKEWMQKYLLLIPIVIFLVCFGWAKLSKYANKVNRAAAIAGGKRTFKEELLYIFHVSFHPFDGFWDLKHEKRGSVRASIVFVTIAILTFFYQAIGQGYLFNPEGAYSTIFTQVISVLVPFFLFAVANWCLTTLFDGEGSLKDIFIAMSYSMLPIPLLIIPSTIFSNFVIEAEMGILTLMTTLAFIWMALLMFVGMMVTHDYSMSKNILTILGTVVGMVFIMFVGVLFTTLLGKLVGFVSNIIIEIEYRM